MTDNNPKRFRLDPSPDLNCEDKNETETTPAFVSSVDGVSAGDENELLKLSNEPCTDFRVIREPAMQIQIKDESNAPFPIVNVAKHEPSPLLENVVDEAGSRIDQELEHKIDLSNLDSPSFETNDTSLPDKTPGGGACSRPELDESVRTTSHNHESRGNDYDDDRDIEMLEMFGCVGFGEIELRSDEVHFLMGLYKIVLGPSSFKNKFKNCGAALLYHIFHTNPELNRFITSIPQIRLDRDTTGIVKKLQHNVMMSNMCRLIHNDPMDDILKNEAHAPGASSFVLAKFQRLKNLIVNVDPEIRKIMEFMTLDPEYCMNQNHRCDQTFGAITVDDMANLQFDLDMFMMARGEHRETKCKKCEEYTVGRIVFNSPAIIMFYTDAQHFQRNNVEKFPLILFLQKRTRTVKYYLSILTILKDAHYTNIIIGQEGGELFVFTVSDERVTRASLRHTELVVGGVVTAIYSCSPTLP